MKFKASSIRLSAIAIAVGMLATGTAYGQSAEGFINGKGKSGDKVTVVNAETGSSRVVVVDSNGNFSLAKLQPGKYTLSAGGISKDVTVSIGSGTSVVMTDAVQTVTVSGRRAVIDMNSTETNVVFTAEQMQALPVARDVNSIALLAPGVIKGDPDLGAGGLPSFGGASVAENGYYINGFDVTNIRNFLSYADLPFDAIGSQQVKSGGYGAEYGRSLGGVISLATKRGTNKWKSGASLIWAPDALRSTAKDVKSLDPESAGGYVVFGSARKDSAIEYNVYSGGPIIKDTLFFFGALTGNRDETDTFARGQSTNFKAGKPNGIIKIDFTPNDSNRLEFTAISNKKETEITDYIRPAGSPIYQTSHVGAGAKSTQVSGGDVLIGKYTGYLTDNLTISALVGSVNDKVTKTTGARQANQDCPVVLDNDFNEIGCWAKPWPGPSVRTPGVADDEDRRRAFRFDVDYSIGDHVIRAGIDNQKFTSAAAGSGQSGGAYWLYRVSANGTINGVPNATTPGGTFARRRVANSTSGEFEVENNAMYIEDTWKVNKNLMAYGGLRSESFDNRNGDGVSFVKKDNLVAPRLGFSLNAKGDGTLKIYGNLGRYYIPVASNTNIRMTRGELFEQRFFTYTGVDPRTQAPTGLSAEIGSPQIVGDGSLANPATIADTKLSPMNQDELILGFQHALTKDWTFGMKGISRRINSGMDDYCSHIGFDNWAKDKGYANFDSSTMAQCILVNPGKDVTLMIDINNDGKLVESTVPAKYLGLSKYTRTHNALEFTLERPFDGKWGVQGSYTLAKTRGSAEGYVNSVINQEDAGVSQDFDFGSLTDGSNGYLSNDRRHTIKVFGNYMINDQLRLGMNAVASSGRPYSCIGFVPESRPDYSDAVGYTTASSYYCLNEKGQSVLVPRGTAGRTPWSATVDMQLSYMPKLGDGKLTLSMDIFNLLNSQQVQEVVERRDYSRDTVGEGKRNPDYGLPSSFQPPRSVRFTARYEF